jgi:hypothetical protein
MIAEIVVLVSLAKIVAAAPKKTSSQRKKYLNISNTFPTRRASKEALRRVFIV